MYIFLIFTIFFSVVRSANILGLFTYPAYSHHALAHKIYRELSLRGHQVTVITTNPLNDPSLTNLTEITLSGAYDIFKTKEAGKMYSKELNYLDMAKNLWKTQYAITSLVINNTDVKKLVQDKTLHFDLVVKAVISPFSFGFGHRFNAPVIDVGPINYMGFVNDRYDNPNHPIIYPDMHVNIDAKTATTWEKITGIFYFLRYKYHYHYVALPQFDKLAKTFFGDDLPYVGDLERNSRIFFTNSNPLLNYGRPNVPGVMEILPLGNDVPNKLPNDLKKLLDGADRGVVYISFGSNVKSATMDKHIHSTIKKAVSELPYLILWKWETDVMPEQPFNVVTGKWFPQKDLLAHPNVKVFITQGGIQSIEQSIASEVPMIGIPFMGDQPANVEKIVKLGIAEKLDPSTLTKAQLKNLIVKVAETETYKSNLKEIRDNLYDAPMTGIKKVVWWSEYIIRHKGAKHLRSDTLDVNWAQYFFLDIIFVAASNILLICIIFKLLAIVRRFLLSPRRTTKEY